MCEKIENDVNEVIPNLWLGNVKSAYDKSFLDKYNITNVLTIMTDFDNRYRYNGINYFVIPIKDENSCTVNMIGIFDMSTQFIFDALRRKEGILVHCKQGHHRSAAIVAGFLIKYLRVAYLSAILYINYLRPCALVRKTCMSDNLFNYYLYLNNIKCEKVCGFFGGVYICKCKSCVK